MCNDHGIICEAAHMHSLFSYLFLICGHARVYENIMRLHFSYRPGESLRFHWRTRRAGCLFLLSLYIIYFSVAVCARSGCENADVHLCKPQIVPFWNRNVHFFANLLGALVVCSLGRAVVDPPLHILRTIVIVELCVLATKHGKVHAKIQLCSIVVCIFIL